MLSAILLCLTAELAMAGDVAASDEKPSAEQPAAKADATSSPATAAAQEFKPPPGFYTKKRGALQVYCKKDREIGTRFVTEKCMTEDQVHEYLLALESQKQDVDRIRSTCGGGSACGSQ
jgi:hypothetical protein